MSSASLFDKLVDLSPDNPSDIGYPLTQRQLTDSLIRDIESILNSRLSWNVKSLKYRELHTSIMQYGLEDFSAMPFSSEEGKNYLCQLVREAILTFEPRLRSVQVEVVTENDRTDRTLNLRIRAVYRFEDIRREIVLDSEVEPVSLGFKMSGLS